jgi:predicted N-acetyltransferase YhbS
MMLVASRHSRRGLGRRLMARMLDLAHGAAVFLFATDLGRPLYAQLGFRVVATSTRYVGLFTPDATLRSDLAARLERPAGLSGLTAVDREVFGADRSRVLAGLAAIADRVVECGEPAAGYAAAWQDGDITIIGPVVADSGRMAATLISSLADECRGPVRVDISSGHPGLAAWAVQRGLQAGATNAVMAYGGALPGDRSRLFAPASVAIG